MAKTEATVSVRNFTRQSLTDWAGLPFSKIAAARLPGWDISLVFAGTTRAQALNIKLRDKTYVPNVLSYVVGEKSGEIIICPQIARREAADYGHSFTTHVVYLFIHGILHLEGRAHGATMEQWEQKLLAQFLPTHARMRTTSHESSHRHRD